jgi:ribose transport system substrate-binding protein
MLTGLEGLPANISLIKQGLQTAVAGVSLEWLGWAAIDGLNRLFAGQPQVDEGIGWQTVDKQHNLPTTPAYDGNVASNGQPKQDYQAIYRKSWGK